MNDKSKPSEGKIEGSIDPLSMEVPAILVNHFQIAVQPDITRIAFGEKMPGMDANFHSAISLTTLVAERLAKVLLNSIEKNKSANPEKKTSK